MSMSDKIFPVWDIVIAGGGPAGFFAAIQCAKLAPRLRILIIEKSMRPLGKILISGGGRCNVTHACYDPAQLVQFYPRGGAALRGAFTRFQPADTIKWFENHGVRLKTEPDNRVFPVSDSSETIADCLTQAARAAEIKIHSSTSLLGAKPCAEGGFDLEIQTARAPQTGTSRIHTKILLFATGSDPKTRAILSSLGHGIIAPVPSLFSFRIKDERLAELAGVSVEDVTLKLKNYVQRGALLITHWGISGPAVLKLSAWAARTLFESNYRDQLTINWLGTLTSESALLILQRNRDWRENASKKVSAQPAFTQIPLRLWKRLTLFLADKNWGDLSRTDLKNLSLALTAGTFEILGKGQYKDEFVTCGGVDLKQVDFKTMQSRLIPGLFFAGEVLDIDGITGGFNFQSAWTTGWLAGNGMAGYFLH